MGGHDISGVHTNPNTIPIQYLTQILYLILPGTWIQKSVFGHRTTPDLSGLSAQTDKQTYRHTDKQTNRHTDKQTNRHMRFHKKIVYVWTGPKTGEVTSAFNCHVGLCVETLNHFDSIAWEVLSVVQLKPWARTELVLNIQTLSRKVLYIW